MFADTESLLLKETTVQYVSVGDNRFRAEVRTGHVFEACQIFRANKILMKE